MSLRDDSSETEMTDAGRHEWVSLHTDSIFVRAIN